MQDLKVMARCSNKSVFGGIIKGIRRDVVTVERSEVVLDVYQIQEF
jgi:hypothetical protein